MESRPSCCGNSADAKVPSGMRAMKGERSSCAPVRRAATSFSTCAGGGLPAQSPRRSPAAAWDPASAGPRPHLDLCRWQLHGPQRRQVLRHLGRHAAVGGHVHIGGGREGAGSWRGGLALELGQQPGHAGGSNHLCRAKGGESSCCWAAMPGSGLCPAHGGWRPEDAGPAPKGCQQGVQQPAAGLNDAVAPNDPWSCTHLQRRR